MIFASVVGLGVYSATLHQFPVAQGRSADDALERVTELLRGVAVVGAPLHPFNVAVKAL